MTTGEIAYLALVLGAFVGFIVAVAIVTWRTEGPPAWLERGASRASATDSDRGPASAARVQ